MHMLNMGQLHNIMWQCCKCKLEATALERHGDGAVRVQRVIARGEQGGHAARAGAHQTERRR